MKSKFTVWRSSTHSDVWTMMIQYLCLLQPKTPNMVVIEWFWDAQHFTINIKGPCNFYETSLLRNMILGILIIQRLVLYLPIVTLTLVSTFTLSFASLLEKRNSKEDMLSKAVFGSGWKCGCGSRENYNFLDWFWLTINIAMIIRRRYSVNKFTAFSFLNHFVFFKLLCHSIFSE